jgi:hypothetical protein
MYRHKTAKTGKSLTRQAVAEVVSVSYALHSFTRKSGNQLFEI